MTSPPSPAPATGSSRRPLDVFISYASADVEYAKALQEFLLDLGFEVWRDKTELEAGDPYIDRINAALDKARRVIVLWSERSIASHWVKSEAEKARGKEKLLALRLEACDIPVPFNTLHTIALASVLENSELITRPLNARRAAGGFFFIPGTKPKLDISRLPTTYAKRLYGREKEMADLNQAWDSAGPQKTNVVVLDAMGGTGKTALVNHFVQGLAAQGWRGAEAVFVWSFYSQGTSETRQASADEFFKTALAWFGHTGAPPASQHDKGVRLAELVAAQRTLLVLDGLEPLQYGPARRPGGAGDAGLAGNLKDQGLRALLRQLGLSNPGLVVVTTRLKVPEFAGRAAPAVVTERLGPIPTPAGIALLRDIGVKGPDRELAELVEELAGHAIALTQVATWLASRRGGDVRAKDELPSLVDLGGADERHPFRVMQLHEIQFKRDIAERLEAGDAPSEIDAAGQLALLFLMGLFDRPMEKGDREALLAAPVIPGLTDGLAGLGRNRIDDAVESLRGLGLLLPRDPSTPDDIDAHPLVREYFGARLEKAQPDAWRAAHGRLYDYYRFRRLPEAFREPVAYAVLALAAAFPEIRDQIARVAQQEHWPDGWKASMPPTLLDADWPKVRGAATLIDGPEWNAALKAFLPETEEAMGPLFAAIAHGCAAGRHTEAWSEVYWPRIARGNENFAAAKLGLYGSELGAVAHFCAEPFSAPAPGLSPARQALVLSLAGFRLRALGRLAEAVEPMRAAVAQHVAQQNWVRAAGESSNMSELLVTLGRLGDGVAGGEAGAVATAAQSVAYADKSVAAFQRMVNRTTHADALLQAGAWRDAARRFAEAEALQRDRQPGLPLLYSLRGYQCCDLKLAQGRAAEVAPRAHSTIAVARRNNWLLDIALDTLSLGRAAHLAALSSPSPHASSAWGEGRGEGQRHTPTSAQVSAPHPSPLPVRTGRGDLPLTPAAQHLDAAVDGLRAAGQLQYLAPGLLARAAYHRDAGNGALAERDLDEAFEIAERGGMRLFLADAHLECARQHLAHPSPDAAALDAAAEAIDRAAAIVAATGYRRRDPDLAFLRAELALARGDAAGAHPHLDALIATMRAHDLWSFLPQVVRLAERHGLADLAPTIADLTEARTRFNKKADEDFEKARKEGDDAAIDPSEIPDAFVEQMLAEDSFRKMLGEALASTGQPELPNLDQNSQRAAARALIAAMMQAQAEADSRDSGEAATPPPPVPPPPESGPRRGLLRRLFRRS